MVLPAGTRCASFAGGISVTLKGVEIAIVDANQGRLERKARSNSVASCTSISASMPQALAAASNSAAWLSETEAMMIKIQSAPSAGFCDLIGVIHKVFAQRRQCCGGAGGGEIAVIALKGRPICQNRQAGRTALLIGAGQLGGLKSARIRPFDGEAFFTSAIKA